MFEKLIHNDFGVKINVLGWGQKWNGFMDKFNGVTEFCKSISDEDLIVFLDGFDTEINMKPENLHLIFDKFKCDILLSKTIYNNYITKRIFGNCQNGYTANAGLYMGKARHIEKLMHEILEEKTSDDQRALNSVCEKTNSIIKIDENSEIFCNGSPSKHKHTNPYFISYPAATNGSITEKLHSHYRMIFEYPQFFKAEIAACICVLILIYKLRKRNN
jgi:hypothetical protein